MIFVMVMFDTAQEAEQFVAECEEEDVPAGIILDLETDWANAYRSRHGVFN